MSHNNPGLVIAVDGYSSCGKSTLAKQLARRLGYVFVDTGAMYRAVTLHFLRNKVDLSSEEAVSAALSDLHVTFEVREGKNFTLLNAVNVEDEIRSIYVSGMVSQVAAIPAVRRKLVALQQALDNGQGLVMDGRDIGTVVFPHADLKFFITADPAVRAKRRYKELVEAGQEIGLKDIEENIRLRDKIDTEREDSPLRCADDAISIDNSHLTIEQQFEIVWDIVLAAIAVRQAD